MWKLVVIRMAQLEIQTNNETALRFNFRAAMENPFVMYAFLYNPKGNLEETYIHTIER